MTEKQRNMNKKLTGISAELKIFDKSVNINLVNCEFMEIPDTKWRVEGQIFYEPGAEVPIWKRVKSLQKCYCDKFKNAREKFYRMMEWYLNNGFSLVGLDETFEVAL